MVAGDFCLQAHQHKNRSRFIFCLVVSDGNLHRDLLHQTQKRPRAHPRNPIVHWKHTQLHKQQSSLCLSLLSIQRSARRLPRRFKERMRNVAPAYCWLCAARWRLSPAMSSATRRTTRDAQRLCLDVPWIQMGRNPSHVTHSHNANTLLFLLVRSPRFVLYATAAQVRCDIAQSRAFALSPIFFVCCGGIKSLKCAMLVLQARALTPNHFFCPPLAHSEWVV